jgi:hypothetical protein
LVVQIFLLPLCQQKQQTMLVLRTNGNEPYVKTKVGKGLATKMEKAGLFSKYNHTFGYIEGDYKSTHFEFMGKKYKIEYFSGCFNPFLLMLK